VRSVARAQTEYRDHLGFDIAWTLEDAGLGAVSHGDCAIFFRETEGEITPTTLWIHCVDLDAVHGEMTKKGANIIAPPPVMPWGLRQFTIVDGEGHKLHFHAG